MSINYFQTNVRHKLSSAVLLCSDQAVPEGVDPLAALVARAVELAAEGALVAPALAVEAEGDAVARMLLLLLLPALPLEADAAPPLPVHREFGTEAPRPEYGSR